VVKKDLHGAFWAIWAFAGFLDRVKHIANNPAIKPEQAYNELNKAAAAAITVALGGQLISLLDIGAFGEILKYFVRGIMFAFYAVQYSD